MHLKLSLHLAAVLCAAAAAASEGPKVRAPWKLELVASAPEIVHPSVVCAAPDGRVFVAEDPMDIREDVPPHAAKGRIWCLHPDGRRTLFAQGLHAVFGMQYLEGRLYVLHNPRLTVFRDDAGVGREPEDILAHTLSEPWALGWNDHIPANFKLGMDGWFYLAVGDKGLDGCTGSDGRKLDLPGGGIVRFRPDGSGLEVHSTGVRNILDVGLNARDEIFSYDNTDEDQWMGRLTHMIEGGFYGYPHDFIPRQPHTLWMMHDFGPGAACGVECETGGALPAEFDGNLFLADFGKRQITRVALAAEGASYRVAAFEDLFIDPPDDFRPVGIAWSADGRSLYICDWQFRDQKANVDVGRLWKLSWTGPGRGAERPGWWAAAAQGRKAGQPADWIKALSHPARAVRLTAQRTLAAAARDGGERQRTEIVAALIAVLKSEAGDSARMHALWALDAIDAGAAARGAILDLAGSACATLAPQALRHLGQRRIEAATPIAVRQIEAAAASIRLQAALLLGKTARASESAALQRALGVEADPTVRYALFTALRETARRHPEVAHTIAAGISSPSAKSREGSLLALRGLHLKQAVEALAPLAVADDPEVAASAVRALGWIALKVPEQKFVWWAYHPAKAPPPARTARWEGSAGALAALAAACAHPAAEVRTEAARALTGIDDPAAVAALHQMLAGDTSRTARLAALDALAAGNDPQIHTTAQELLDSPDAEFRMAALKHLRAPLGDRVRGHLERLLAQGALDEKLAVVRAIERTADASGTPLLLEAARDSALRDAAARALAAVPDMRAAAIYIDALASNDPAASQAARAAIRQLGRPLLEEIAARADSIPPGVRGTLRELFKDDPEASAHPLFSRLPSPDPAAYARHATEHAGDPVRGQAIFLGAAGASCSACHKVAGHGGTLGPDLTLAGRQFSRAEIIESILHPARVVREGYRQSEVRLGDGRTLSGLVLGETAADLKWSTLAGEISTIPKSSILERRELPGSLMPEGLHTALTLEQFTDLVAYMASRVSDPRTAPVPPLPSEFIPLFNGHDLAGWRLTDQNRSHWKVREGRLWHDGAAGDLWTERAFGDFELLLDWRWPGPPKLADFPQIDASGKQTPKTERVADGGDSGVFLRGLRKAQVNLFCYPVGSGEFWEYREDASQPPGFAATVTPKRRADAPAGDWNQMRIRVEGSRVTVHLNGHDIISAADLPGLPPQGPIGFQHEHGEIEFRMVAIRALDAPDQPAPPPAR
jgi:putative membrane-bound dehydrogenase-like protein